MRYCNDKHSLSPDGRRYLLNAKTGGVLMIWDELGGTLKFITPAAELESFDTVEMMANQLDAISGPTRHPKRGWKS